MPRYNVDVSINVWGSDTFEVEASDRAEAEATAIDIAYDLLSSGYFDTEIHADSIEEIDEEDEPSS